jgi:hypothetical protein
MDTLRLLRPVEEYIDKIRAHRKGFLASNDSMDGTGDL